MRTTLMNNNTEKNIYVLRCKIDDYQYAYEVKANKDDQQVSFGYVVANLKTNSVLVEIPDDGSFMVFMVKKRIDTDEILQMAKKYILHKSKFTQSSKLEKFFWFATFLFL